MCVLAVLLHLLDPGSPMGNRSSSGLVANGSNIAGLLLLVAGGSPFFGSQVSVALKCMDLAFWACLPAYACVTGQFPTHQKFILFCLTAGNSNTSQYVVSS